VKLESEAAKQFNKFKHKCNGIPKKFQGMHQIIKYQKKDVRNKTKYLYVKWKQTNANKTVNSDEKKEKNNFSVQDTQV
jgi:hypothetical protein